MATRVRSNQIVFRIIGFTPATLPSARLAQYLLDLDALLGSTSKIHFQRLGKGSAEIIQWAEAKVLPTIRQRAMSLRLDRKNQALQLTEAYERLNQRLVADNASGTLKIGRENVLDFPGRRTEERQIIGPVVQSEVLDGQLVRIGGIDATVPVHLRDGEEYHFCTANIELAKKLAPYLYGQTIRVFGTAYWYRFPGGNWKLGLFRVENFQPLKDIPLVEAVEHLRAIPKEEWDDTITEKIKLRHGG